MTTETRLRRLLAEKLAPTDREEAERLLSLVIADLESRLIDMENLKGQKRTAPDARDVPNRDENGRR